MIIQASTFVLRGCLALILFGMAGMSASQELDMRTVDHQGYQLQVPVNWDSFDSETPDGGLVQIFYDPDLKVASRQCMLESSVHKLSANELADPSMKSPWRQTRWMQVLPHIADASNVVMKESSFSRNGQGEDQHVGEFTFYASQFFWHSRSYVMHSANRLLNLTCSAASHNSPIAAEKAFEQIRPVIGRIANSISTK